MQFQKYGKVPKTCKKSCELNYTFFWWVSYILPSKFCASIVSQANNHSNISIAYAVLMVKLALRMHS